MSTWLVIFLLLCFMIFSLNESNEKEFTMMTYNVWNYMFSWKIRFLRIREMIEENSVDIVTLQEIYSNEKNINDSKEDNQLKYLLSLLSSSYKYYHFSANHNNNNNTSNNNGEENGNILEGLAIISKYPISNINKYFFKERSNNPDSGDMNARMLLKTTINLNRNGYYAIDLYLTHLTYDKTLQCKHINELLLQIQHNSLSNNANANIKNIFVTGDLNVYSDYLFPMQLLQYGISDNKRCNSMKTELDNIPIQFIDVFESQISNENKILTFSNMPWPGMISRPDRLYVANINNAKIKIKSIQIIGDGKYYKDNFYYKILWNRLWNALKGNKCKIDCGPNGYCKCGNCVINPHAIVDEMKGCDHDNSCANCLHDMYSLLKCCFVITFVHVIVYYACIHGLYMAPRLKYNSHSNLSIRTLILFVISFVLCLLLIVWYFTRIIQYTIVNMLPEELFPSDHRGLLATFQYSM